jgi:hypothetical protein
LWPLTAPVDMVAAAVPPIARANAICRRLSKVTQLISLNAFIWDCCGGGVCWISTAVVQHQLNASVVPAMYRAKFTRADG